MSSETIPHAPSDDWVGGSQTLKAILKHWTLPAWPGAGHLDLPFNIEEFCRDMDERLRQRDLAVTLTTESESEFGWKTIAETRASQMITLAKECDRLRAEVGRLNKIINDAT
jgi:hypothetical protein